MALGNYVSQLIFFEEFLKMLLKLYLFFISKIYFMSCPYIDIVFAFLLGHKPLSLYKIESFKAVQNQFDNLVWGIF